MDDREREERERVVAIARTWLRTPYHDHAHIKGAGADCGQLIGAVFEEAGLIKDFSTGYYSPQWYLHRGEEAFLGYVRQWATDIEPEAAGLGDIVVFKVGRLYAHGALIVDPGYPRIIHAFKNARCVVEDDGGPRGPLRGRARKFFSFKGWAR